MGGLALNSEKQDLLIYSFAEEIFIKKGIVEVSSGVYISDEGENCVAVSTNDGVYVEFYTFKEAYKDVYNQLG